VDSVIPCTVSYWELYTYIYQQHRHVEITDWCKQTSFAKNVIYLQQMLLRSTCLAWWLWNSPYNLNRDGHAVDVVFWRTFVTQIAK